MIWAIDVGNSQTQVGRWDGSAWLEVLHHETDSTDLEAWLVGLFGGASGPSRDDLVCYASVVPSVNPIIDSLADGRAVAVEPSPKLGLPIKYDPPTSLGADRIANALGALARFKPPILVIDLGTATTFDAIDLSGAFVGGAIMPGPETNAAALISATAQLPAVLLQPPPSPIGTNTAHALQSGLVLGYAAGVQGLAIQISESLGANVKVVATGGLAPLFAPLCPIISETIPMLTLEGIVVAATRLASN